MHVREKNTFIYGSNNRRASLNSPTESTSCCDSGSVEGRNVSYLALMDPRYHFNKRNKVGSACVVTCAGEFKANV